MEGSVSAFGGWLYRRTSGKRGGKIDGVPVCLLTLRRKGSRRARSVRVPYAIRGRTILLIAGSRNESKAPDWYADVAAHPKVRIQVGGQSATFTVKLADDDEKEALWAYAATSHRDFHLYYLPKYESKPLLVCTPLERRSRPRPS